MEVGSLIKRVLVIFSGTGHSKFFLSFEIINHSSYPWNDERWVMGTSIIALPNLLLFHVSTSSIKYLFSLIGLSGGGLVV